MTTLAIVLGLNVASIFWCLFYLDNRARKLETKLRALEKR